MKRLFKYRNVWVVALAMALVGCVSSDDIDAAKRENMKIRLWAGIGKSPANTQSVRGNASSTSGILTPSSKEKLRIGMVRIDELYSGNYPAFVGCGNDGNPNPIQAELDVPKDGNSGYRDINFISSSQFFYTATDVVKFAAWYPYGEGVYGSGVYNSTDEKTTITFPVPGDVDVMYGNVVSGTQDDGFEVMTFDHALCVYRIYIYCMRDGDEGSNWGKLETMKLEDLPNSCTITLPTEKNGEEAKRFTITYAGKEDVVLNDPNNNIFFDPGESIPVDLRNRRLVAKCVCAPPADGLLNISLTTSEATARQRVSIARNFQAGHAYDIVLRFSDHGLINPDVSVEDWNKHDHDVTQEVAVEMFYDLSRYGTANCYLINSANYGYSFNATVKGNGDSSLVGNDDTTLNPGYVDILWTDMPTVEINGEQKQTVQLVSNRLSNNRVLLKVLGNPKDTEDKTLKAEGNVIIAAYKDESKSEILWTWHLWITDRVNNHGNPNGYIVQDRNLGAIAAEPENGSGKGMLGLYYQWGRPTPFRMPEDNTRKVPSDTAQAADAEWAVKNPTTLYGANASNNDWLETTNNQLWGYQNDFTKAQKTIYDPCPQGYMVADKRVWESIATYQTTDGWQDGGLGAKINVGGTDIWYPIQGYISADGTCVPAVSNVRLWSSVVDINSTKNPFELRYNASGDATAVAQQTKRNVALPVRCVSGHSVESITNLSAAQTANCYMVHRSGYYKFKANVRGNGVVQLLTTNSGQLQDIADGMSANFTPAKVDFLWYQGDFNNGWKNDENNKPPVDPVNPKNYKYAEKDIPMLIMDDGKLDEDGYVTFYVGEFRKGNIGLAAYDDAGNIIWSWHFWFTDRPKNIVTGKAHLMDRFLGATFAPAISGTPLRFSDANQQLATFGFYYQWGKKDPFFGPRTIDAKDDSSDAPQCSTYWVKDKGAWTASDTFVTDVPVRVSFAPATPMTFRKRSNENAKEGAGSHWYTDDFVTGSRNQNMWGYCNTGSEYGEGYSKTVHDPCPPGYRVMHYQVWYYNSFTPSSTNSESYVNSSDAKTTTLSTELNYNNGGIVLTKKGFYGPEEEDETGPILYAWYPYVGQRDGWSGCIQSVAEIGYISTCMPRGTYNTRYYVYNKANKTSGQNHDSGGGSATGRVVRCMKE